MAVELNRYFHYLKISLKDGVVNVHFNGFSIPSIKAWIVIILKGGKNYGGIASTLTSKPEKKGGQPW